MLFSCVSEETEVVCRALESWTLLGLSAETDAGPEVVYNLVGVGSLAAVKREVTERGELVLCLSAVAATGECEGASDVGLVELADMDSSQVE